MTSKNKLTNNKQPALLRSPVPRNVTQFQVTRQLLGIPKLVMLFYVNTLEVLHTT